MKVNIESEKVNKTVYLAGFQISFKSRIAKPSKFIIIELSWDQIWGFFSKWPPKYKNIG
jgi:hypothetical protein